jgi:hypothetical protein
MLLLLLEAMKQQYVKTLFLIFCAFIGTKTMAQSGVQLSGGLRIEDNNADLPYLLKSDKDISGAIEKNLFIRVNVSKENCVVGEPILVTYKLYTRLQSESKLLKQPDFNGCSVIEMTTTDIEAEREVIGGKIFKSYIIRRVQLIPLQEGELTLGAATLDNTISFYKTAEEIAFRRPSVTHNATISNQPKLIHVASLPLIKQPANFANTIGHFIISVKVLKTTDTANDNNSLEIRIDGIGNFQNLVCPTINWPSNIDHFDIETAESIDKLSFPVLGKKIFTIPFSYKHKGLTVIPPISFSYFDADKHVYNTIATSSININVLPAVEKIDATKISAEVGNGKYIWIVPCIAMIAGLILWLTFFRKKTAVTIKEDEAQIIVDAPIIVQTDVEKLNELLVIEDDKQFFQAAKILAVDLLYQAKEATKQAHLQQIIGSCNQVLYAYDTTILKENIFEQLEQLITV